MTSVILTSRHESGSRRRAGERSVRLVSRRAVRRSGADLPACGRSISPTRAGLVKMVTQIPLAMHKVTEAARAFDQAIGLRPESATALWGGALAHAELGNNVMAQNYLRRTLVLQPTWFSMAMTVPQLVPLLQISTRAADLLKVAFGPFSGKHPCCRRQGHRQLTFDNRHRSHREPPDFRAVDVRHRRDVEPRLAYEAEHRLPLEFS